MNHGKNTTKGRQGASRRVPFAMELVTALDAMAQVKRILMNLLKTAIAAVAVEIVRDVMVRV